MFQLCLIFLIRDRNIYRLMVKYCVITVTVISENFDTVHVRLLYSCRENKRLLDSDSHSLWHDSALVDPKSAIEYPCNFRRARMTTENVRNRKWVSPLFASRLTSAEVRTFNDWSSCIICGKFIKPPGCYYNRRFLSWNIICVEYQIRLQSRC